MFSVNLFFIYRTNNLTLRHVYNIVIGMGLFFYEINLACDFIAKDKKNIGAKMRQVDDQRYRIIGCFFCFN